MSKRDASPERIFGKCAECKGPRKVGEVFLCQTCLNAFNPCSKCWTEHAADTACPKNNVKEDFIGMLEGRQEELGFGPNHYIRLIRRDLGWLE